MKGSGGTQDASREAIYVECPRDSWQGLDGVIPTELKRRHIRALIGAGFTHLDLGSFVSRRAVPQMADTEELLEGIEAPASVDLLCIIGNERGLERAFAAKGVTSVGYPLSVNDTFQRRNLGVSVEESWPLVERLANLTAAAGMGFVVYLSMGFGNPYGEPWRPEVTAGAVKRLRELGVKRISLADTVGNADAKRIGSVLAAVTEPETLGLHLHSRPGAYFTEIEEALRFGVRWFEGALGGVGGCPFAADALVGNLPTEEVVPFLEKRGLSTGVKSARLSELARSALRVASAAAA